MGRLNLQDKNPLCGFFRSSKKTFTSVAKVIDRGLEGCAFLKVALFNKGVVGGARRKLGVALPQGGQDMLKKVLFPACWFLPLFKERSPPV